jgi:hypothetical protein
MKTLCFTITHANLEALMGDKRLVRVFALQDLGRERDHYEITALVREEDIDTVIELSADHPRWVRWS